MSRKLDDVFHARNTMDGPTLREYQKGEGRAPSWDKNPARPSVFPPNVFGESPKQGTPNFSPERSMEVPGIDLMDRMMDQQDMLDRRDLKQRLGVKDDPKDAA